ncbi:MAG: CRISPR-associated endonuclease Cas2 [Candidatus Vogelbacteria bacterium]|nr:CRISPR-associated endonuclease Cas2 [Candidatus Vogelbacteria bacterium]
MTTERRTKVKQAVLATVGVAGVLMLAAVAPNCVQLLRYVIKSSGQRATRLYYIKSVVGRMADAGLVSFGKNNEGQTTIRLTDKGRKELKRYGIGTKVISKPRRWDGKYRLIIFDIKEWKRNVRNELRNWLRQLGFLLLQRSVWVYPYECREVIVLLKAHFKIGREVLYITADEIENDRWLRQEFGLE